MEFEHDGIVGYGEGAPVDYWGETPDTHAGIRSRHEAPRAARRRSVRARGIDARLAAGDGPAGRQDGARRRAPRLARQAARAAGLAAARALADRRRRRRTRSASTRVEGTADRTRRAQRLRGAEDQGRRPGRPRAAAGRARGHERALRIDGNEGWTLETARELMPRADRAGRRVRRAAVPGGDLDSYHALRELSPRLPVLIDEGCRISRASRRSRPPTPTGSNIKLSKCGGIREALRMIHAARALGLQVMLGCMIESELGIAQAAQLALAGRLRRPRRPPADLDAGRSRASASGRAASCSPTRPASG